MFPIGGKWVIPVTEEPNKPVYVVNQGSAWRTFTQYGDAEAYAMRLDMEVNPVTVLEIKPVLTLESP